MPIHLQDCSKKLGFKKGDFANTEKQSKKILSLPINQFVQKKHIVMGSKEDDITSDILNLVNQKIKSVKID